MADASVTRRRFGALLGAIPVLLGAGLPVLANATPKTHRVQITKFTFEPSVLTIAVGDTIEWINEDFAPHTATEMEETIWDTGELARGDSGRVTFSEAGEHAYFCVFHPHMRGRISVV